MLDHVMKLDHRATIFDRSILDSIRYFPRPARVRILVVLDTLVQPGPPGAGFDLGRVVSYLRSEPFGFVGFEVDFARCGTTPNPDLVAVDPTPGEWGVRYENFRLDSRVDGRRVIDGYEQVWFFGFEPSIHDDGNNSSVTESPYSPTDAEVAVFSAWMDAGGGVLAMGDHNFLGSAMCWKLPRVGTMRAWLKDDNDARSVPNRSGTDRHDTNRPQNAGQDPTMVGSPTTIPTSAENDTVTQPLEWKPYPVWSTTRLQQRTRPHPVLCGGSLGVIDRFPDHPHEGLVIDERHIDFARKCTHDSSKDEYPTLGVTQPRAEVVAWVNALASPPYLHAKGDQPARRIPAIGVYDGHSIEHGRVLVDSTWHHWFDTNIAQLEAANTDDFKKIKRYFQNVAIWLSTPAAQRRMLAYAAFWTTLTPSAIENLTLDLPLYALGGHAIDVLGRRTSDCLVRSWLLDRIDLDLFDIFRRPPIGPEPCWSCPPEDIFTHSIMGGIIRRVLPLRDALMKAVVEARGKEPKIPFDPERVDALVERGIHDGLEHVMKSIERNRSSFDRASKLTQAALSRVVQQGKAREGC